MYLILLYNQFSHPPHFFCPSLSPAPLSTDLRAPHTPRQVSLTTPCYLFGGPRPEAGCARRLLGNIVQPPDGPSPVKRLGLLGHQNQGARARDRPVRKPRRVEAHPHTITRRPRPPTVGEPTSPTCLRGNRWPQRTVGSVVGQGRPVLKVRRVAVMPLATASVTILRHPGDVVPPSPWPLITQAGGRPPPGNKFG